MAILLCLCMTTAMADDCTIELNNVPFNPGGVSSGSTMNYDMYNKVVFTINTGLTGTRSFGKFSFRVTGPEALDTRTRLGSGGAYDTCGFGFGSASPCGINSPYIETSSCAVSLRTVLCERDYFLQCDFGMQTLDVPSGGTLWLFIKVNSGSNGAKLMGNGPYPYTDTYYQVRGYQSYNDSAVNSYFASFALEVSATCKSSVRTISCF